MKKAARFIDESAAEDDWDETPRAPVSKRLGELEDRLDGLHDTLNVVMSRLYAGDDKLKSVAMKVDAGGVFAAMSRIEASLGEVEHVAKAIAAAI